MRFTIFQESRKGSRKVNQDRIAYTYSRDTLLLVVADGMGGHAGGEIAAQIAVRPFIDSELVEKVIAEAFQTGAAIVGIVPVDTVKRVHKNKIRDTLPREDTEQNVQLALNPADLDTVRAFLADAPTPVACTLIADASITPDASRAAPSFARWTCALT